jgi:hypothetical protein
MRRSCRCRSEQILRAQSHPQPPQLVPTKAIRRCCCSPSWLPTLNLSRSIYNMGTSAECCQIKRSTDSLANPTVYLSQSITGLYQMERSVGFCRAAHVSEGVAWLPVCLLVVAWLACSLLWAVGFVCCWSCTTVVHGWSNFKRADLSQLPKRGLPRKRSRSVHFLFVNFCVGLVGILCACTTLCALRAFESDACLLLLAADVASITQVGCTTGWAWCKLQTQALSTPPPCIHQPPFVSAEYSFRIRTSQTPTSSEQCNQPIKSRLPRCAKRANHSKQGI